MINLKKLVKPERPEILRDLIVLAEQHAQGKFRLKALKFASSYIVYNRAYLYLLLVVESTGK